jgi:hypothetical protein
LSRATEAYSTEEDDMGAWGYGAYENDAAGDWLFQHIVPRLLRTISSKGADPHEALAALAVAHDLALAPWLDLAEVDAAFARIEEADEASGWDDPTRRRRYVRTLQRRIHKALSSTTRSWSPLCVIASKDPPTKKTPTTKPRRTTKARVSPTPKGRDRTKPRR